VAAGAFADVNSRHSLVLQLIGDAGAYPRPQQRASVNFDPVPANAPKANVDTIPGRMLVSSPAGTLQCVVEPGRALVVGSDPACDLVLPGNTVAPRHVIIERRGPGWIVRVLPIADTTWLLDETGRAYPVLRDIGLLSGELVVGGVHLGLYPPA